LPEAAEIERRLAQQMTYCLQAMGCSTLWTSGAAPSSIGARRRDGPDRSRASLLIGWYKG